MKSRVVLSWWLSLVLTLLAPVTQAQRFSDRFIIDATKPFAYVRFDHVARRKHPSRNEFPTGLWLRLVNNCRLPIAVTANGPEPGEPGVTVEYDVVPILISGFPVLGRFSGPSESARSSQVESPSDMNEKPPKGHSADVVSRLAIPPGGNLLFSVPFNAVKECRHLSGPKPFTPCWYVQVPFHFLLPGALSVQEPKILVDFGWEDLPEEVR
jgi:hypothetical protein